MKAISFQHITPQQLDKRWSDHCKGYVALHGAAHTGDEFMLIAIAHLYNCKVIIHKKDFSTSIGPPNALITLHLVLYEVLYLKLNQKDGRIIAPHAHLSAWRRLSGWKEFLIAW
jgi:hypothetical protein